jgi:hypothetical protein
MKKTEIINRIIEFFKENEDLFNDCIEELDSYNGYLGDNRYYEMELLNEFYHGVDATEILERAYFGRDDETWHTDASGNKIYESFNPNREYFSYNGYGNLVSSDYKDYSVHLDDYFIDAIIDNKDCLYLDDEITAILEADNDEIL